MKKIICFALIALFFVLSFSAIGADNQLEVTECIQINDTQLLIKFSEPVAINLHDTNRGPWIALRIVDDNNVLQYDGGNPLQYQGECQFVGKNHDTILFKYGTEGVITSTDVINFQGDIARYYKEGLKVKMCIEEVPYNTDGEIDDELIDNVTTLDGTVRLSANGPAGWDGIYTDIQVNFDYEIDLSNLEPLTGVDNFKYGQIMSIEKSPEEPQKLNPLWFIAGAAAVAVAVVIVIIARKAGKKA